MGGGSTVNACWNQCEDARLLVSKENLCSTYCPCLRPGAPAGTCRRLRACCCWIRHGATAAASGRPLARTHDVGLHRWHRRRLTDHGGPHPPRRRRLRCVGRSTAFRELLNSALPDDGRDHALDDARKEHPDYSHEASVALHLLVEVLVPEVSDLKANARATGEHRRDLRPDVPHQDLVQCHRRLRRLGRSVCAGRTACSAYVLRRLGSLQIVQEVVQVGGSEPFFVDHIHTFEHHFLDDDLPPKGHQQLLKLDVDEKTVSDHQVRRVVALEVVDLEVVDLDPASHGIDVQRAHLHLHAQNGLVEVGNDPLHHGAEQVPVPIQGGIRGSRCRRGPGGARRGRRRRLCDPINGFLR
mmetsp:Transcript_30678/g.102061  ORF Transcript_30678/g.102061 Transcript_30678/m.102061 type:complete len:355 (-) Transcript_30678:76-1140(-)